MKNTIRVDFENHCLVMDRTFAKKAQDVRSEEYAILQKVRLEYPEYCVKRRSIKRNEHKESYRGLTYRYMEKYIASHENAAEHRAEYDELREIADCHSVRYPRIKEWFLATYPEIERFGVRDIEEVASGAHCELLERNVGEKIGA